MHASHSHLVNPAPGSAMGQIRKKKRNTTIQLTTTTQFLTCHLAATNYVLARGKESALVARVRFRNQRSAHGTYELLGACQEVRGVQLRALISIAA